MFRQQGIRQVDELRALTDNDMIALGLPTRIREKLSLTVDMR